MDKGLTGIAKILPFPSDNPLSYSVTYEGKTHKNSVIYKGNLVKNTNEYIFNENNLNDIAKRIIKRDNSYLDILDDKIEKRREEYYEIQKLRNYNTNFTEEEKKLHEEYTQQLNDYTVQIDKLYDKLNSENNSEKKSDIEKEINDIIMKRYVIELKKEELNKPEYYYTHKNEIDERFKENMKEIGDGEFPELRKMIIDKRKNLFEQLMRWRESRLLPMFKNNLNLLLSQRKYEEENNMVLKFYDLFYSIYRDQLNDYYPKDPKKQTSINNELIKLNIKNIPPIIPDDLITIDNCPFHHKFVKQKLTNYFQSLYEKKAKNISCNTKYIDDKIKGYKKQLIQEYLIQQAKGLTAPLPVEPKPYVPEINPEFENEYGEEDINEEFIENIPITNLVKNKNILNVKTNNIKITTNIFNKSMIREKVKVPFKNIGKNMEVYFVKYAKDKIEGRCRNEGYIRKNSCRIITYTSGIVNGTDAIYNVVYLCEVCMPYHNMEVECYIKNITKLGVRAVLTDVDNPMVIYISKEHHKFDLDSIPFQEDEKLTVSICGYHFEKNDEYISAFGILNEMNIPHK